MTSFNIRVYGFLIKGEEVLVSDEREYGTQFTKFPGGGLELGEGVVDCLIREFQEECQITIDIVKHIHTSEQYVRSAFNDSQVIAVHYLVQSDETPKGRFVDRPFDFETAEEPNQVFRWVPIEKLAPEELTFEMDRVSWRKFLAQR